MRKLQTPKLAPLEPIHPGAIRAVEYTKLEKSVSAASAPVNNIRPRNFVVPDKLRKIDKSVKSVVETELAVPVRNETHTVSVGTEYGEEPGHTNTAQVKNRRYKTLLT